MRRIFADHPLTSSEKNKRDYERNGDKRRKRNKEYHKLHKEEIRIRHRCNQHGVTQEWVNAQLLKQDNKCAICLQFEVELNRKLSVDHCHTTGKIRGLLCSRCNRLLGMTKDNTELFRKAANYIESNGVF